MATTTKPEPILADKLLGQSVRDERGIIQHIGKNVWTMLKQAVRSSQKFVITNEAYERIRDALNAFPEQLVYNSKFARPPHDTVWLELAHSGRDLPPFLQQVLGRKAMGNTGYLIHNGTIYTIIENPDNSVVVQLWCADLHTPPTWDEQKRFMDAFGFTTESLDHAYWGKQIYPTLPENLRSRLRMEHRARLLPGKTSDDINPGDWTHLHEHLDMSVRIVLATLLAFNQPKSVLNITTKDAQRRMTAKGPKTYFAHNVVTINLGSKQQVRLNFGGPRGEHASPRWHEVMGHFVTNRTARTANCTHGFGEPTDWWVAIESDDGKQRWECLGCGGKRTWRTYPEGRGDASRGMSLHHHVVKG